MMDAEFYKSITGYRSQNGRQGGQELLLPEIISALKYGNTSKVWLPFFSSGCLDYWLRRYGWETITNLGRDTYDECPVTADSLYFGTPTIVNGKELFPDNHFCWTKERERFTVRKMVEAAVQAGYKMIISGLGSGDISPEERLQDMGGGKMICFKDFGDFQDYLFVRFLK